MPVAPGAVCGCEAHAPRPLRVATAHERGRLRAAAGAVCFDALFRVAFFTAFFVVCFRAGDLRNADLISPQQPIQDENLAGGANDRERFALPERDGHERDQALLDHGVPQDQVRGGTVVPGAEVVSLVVVDRVDLVFIDEREFVNVFRRTHWELREVVVFEEDHVAVAVLDAFADVVGIPGLVVEFALRPRPTTGKELLSRTTMLSAGSET